MLDKSVLKLRIVNCIGRTLSWIIYNCKRYGTYYWKLGQIATQQEIDSEPFDVETKHYGLKKGNWYINCYLFWKIKIKKSSDQVFWIFSSEVSSNDICDIVDIYNYFVF